MNGPAKTPGDCKAYVGGQRSSTEIKKVKKVKKEDLGGGGGIRKKIFFFLRIHLPLCGDGLLAGRKVPGPRPIGAWLFLCVNTLSNV